MDIPKHLSPIIYTLHGIYLEKVRHVKNSRYKTSFGVVKRHVYSLDTALVYYLLTQEKQVHKKTVETLTNTNTQQQDEQARRAAARRAAARRATRRATRSKQQEDSEE